MSLSIAYGSASSGLSLAEKKIATLSANITNADVAGYTRKTYTADYITSNGVTTPVNGKVTAAVNATLLKSLSGQASSYYYQSTVSAYLSDYSNAYGNTATSGTTLSSAITSLDTALQGLASTPTDSTKKAQVVNAAQLIATQLNTLSRSITSQVREANDAIATSVDTINSQLSALDKLNTAITLAQARGDSTAALEDQRASALQSLSQQLGIQYSIDSTNRATIYTSSGDLLLGSKPASLSLTNGSVMLNGKDVTSTIGSGTLGALLTLRDDTFPAEMEKLDTLASELAETMNQLLGEGSALPPPNSITGSTAVNGSDAIGGSGTWRVAVTDASGTVVSVADLDLSSYATMDDLVAGLNTISGLSASLDANGKLVITADDSANGVSLNGMDSDVDGLSANQFFGFGSLFDGHTAANIKVSSYLLTNSDALATGTLSTSSTLAVGDVGISSGNTTITDAMVDALAGKNSFAASGNFAARTVTFASYASAIIADAAMQASTAQSSADVAEATYTYTQDKLSSETGVNINEEMALMTQLQNYYEANATVISTLRDMFSTLLQSIS